MKDAVESGSAASAAVGEAFGFEHEGGGFVCLELAQRFGGAPGVLLGLVAFGNGAHVGFAEVEIDLLAGDGVRPLAAHGHRLVLDDDLEPHELGGGLDAVEAAQGDLQAALQCVVGVVGAQRGAARASRRCATTVLGWRPTSVRRA